MTGHIVGVQLILAIINVMWSQKSNRWGRRWKETRRKETRTVRGKRTDEGWVGERFKRHIMKTDELCARHHAECH